MTHTEFQKLFYWLTEGSQDPRIIALAQGYDQLYAAFPITEQAMNKIKTYTDLQNFAFHHGIDLDAEDRGELEEALVEHFNNNTNMASLAYHSLTDEVDRYDDSVDAFMSHHKKKLCSKFVDEVFALLHSDER